MQGPDRRTEHVLDRVPHVGKDRPKCDGHEDGSSVVEENKHGVSCRLDEQSLREHCEFSVEHDTPGFGTRQNTCKSSVSAVQHLPCVGCLTKSRDVTFKALSLRRVLIKVGGQMISVMATTEVEDVVRIRGGLGIRELRVEFNTIAVHRVTVAQSSSKMFRRIDSGTAVDHTAHPIAPRHVLPNLS